MLCNEDSIYYATATGVIGITSNGTSSSTILTAQNALLEYDTSSGRLIYFDELDQTLSSVKLDGSDKVVISTGESIKQFSIDYISRTIYYIDRAGNNDIKSLNINNRTDISVVLEAITGSLGGNVNDLDVDPEMG